MSRVKDFFADCAYRGQCPISHDTIQHLETLETSFAIDWIAYVEIEYMGYDGQTHYTDGISLESARRLISINQATAEIVNFVEEFGWFVD